LIPAASSCSLLKLLIIEAAQYLGCSLFKLLAKLAAFARNTGGFPASKHRRPSDVPKTMT
jgi:hypothetical protein